MGSGRETQGKHAGGGHRERSHIQGMQVITLGYNTGYYIVITRLNFLSILGKKKYLTPQILSVFSKKIQKRQINVLFF